MLRVFQSRVTRTVAFSVLGVVACAAADAGVRPKLRPTLSAESPTILASATEFSSRPSYSVPAPAEFSSPPPARYFTINEVLAKGSRSVSPSTRLAAVDPSDIASDAAPSSAPVSRTTDEPFGFATFRAPEGLLWSKWRKVQSEISSETQVMIRCDSEPETCASPAAKKFLALVKNARKRDGRDQIDFINRAVNAELKYTTDFAQHGVADLWSAPVAAFASGRGDCEDYAIAKYVAFREAGRAPEDLRLLLVHDNAVRMDHAVLAVRHDGRWLVLDNRHAVLLEQRDTRFFTPLFALDQSGVKLFAAPYAKATTPGGPAQAPVSFGDEPGFSLRGTVADAVPAASSGLYDAPLLI